MLRSIFGWGALLWVGSVQATWTAITTPLSEIASDYEEYSVAINDEGQVIASFGGELFGRCDVQGGQWNFTSFEELRTRYCRENEQEPPEKEKEFSIDKGLYVSINNKGEGFVLFRVPYGQDQDDLAV
ncbi:MAG: hypothetical protein FJZ63_07820, partial [Chlamydiae bacterium]|nr:hypothetical protein [Chlamydiota bacterium]